MNTDCCAIIIIESALVLITITACYFDITGRRKDQANGLIMEATRGEKTMSALYSVYVTSLAALYVLVSEAQCLAGNRVTILAIDFLLLTYLLFFCSWFRNMVFFRLKSRFRKD